MKKRNDMFLKDFLEAQIFWKHINIIAKHNKLSGQQQITIYYVDYDMMNLIYSH